MTERGLALDPFNPFLHAAATLVYYGARRFEDAQRQNALGMEINPNFPTLIGSGAVVEDCLGNLDRAISGYRRAAELTASRPLFVSFLGHALAITGQEAEAKQILQRLLDLPVKSPLDIARVYLGLRDIEQALNWLEKAMQERFLHLLAVPVDHRWDGIRQHPRFQNILRQLSLP